MVGLVLELGISANTFVRIWVGIEGCQHTPWSPVLCRPLCLRVDRAGYWRSNCIVSLLYFQSIWSHKMNSRVVGPLDFERESHVFQSHSKSCFKATDIAFVRLAEGTSRASTLCTPNIATLRFAYPQARGDCGGEGQTGTGFCPDA